MDFTNLFSLATVYLLLAALVGAAVHYWKGNKLEANAQGFWDWLIGTSPVKSLAVGVLLIAGVVLMAGSGMHGLIGWLFAGLFGYTLDSLLKRV